MRANQLFTVFAKEFKVEGVQRLYNETADIVRFQSESVHFGEVHFKAYQCWKAYKLVIDAHDSWQLRYDGMPQRDRDTVIALQTKYIRDMLTARCWLNPRCCAVQDVSSEQLDEVRRTVLRRLLDTVYQFVEESGEYAFCLEICTIFAEDRFGYYRLFRHGDDGKAVIRRLLDMVKEAKIEMIRIRQHAEQRLQSRGVSR